MACETRIDAVIKATVTDLIRAEISGQPEGRVSAQISAVTGRGVKGVALENGEIVFTMSDGAKVSIGKLPEADIPKATETAVGAVMAGDHLSVDENGRMSVDVSETVEQNDDGPVSGGAVYELIGKVENALAGI